MHYLSSAPSFQADEKGVEDFKSHKATGTIQEITTVNEIIHIFF